MGKTVLYTIFSPISCQVNTCWVLANALGDKHTLTETLCFDNIATAQVSETLSVGQAEHARVEPFD